MEYQDRGRRDGYRYAGRYGDLPVCCIALVAINVLVYLIGILIPSLGYRMEEAGCFGAIYLLYENGYYRLITSGFLHADIEHLINNMILLYFAGEIVEKSLGKARFLILYLLAEISGNLLSAAYELSTGCFYSTIGASGAVFGLTGALLFLVIARKGAAAEISMQRMLIAVLLSLYAGFRNGSVNNAAHIGGLVAGFLLAFLLSIIPRLGRKGDRGR